LTTAVAIAWLVALAVAVDSVGLMLQIWLVSVAAALAGLRLVRRPTAEKAQPAADDAEAQGSGSEPASQQAAEAKLGPSPAPQLAIGSASEAGASLEVWTATDVSRVLRVPLPAVIAEMSSGHMPGNTVAGEWRVRAAALVDWLDGAYGERRARS
jgi:hypothetical protein